MASKLTYLGLRIPNDLYSQLKELAKHRNINVSDFCREHLESLVRGTAGNGQDDAPLTKAELRSLERLFFSVFISEKLLLGLAMSLTISSKLQVAKPTSCHLVC